MGTNQRDKQKNKLAEYWKAFIDTVGALIWKMNFILEFQGFAIRCQDDGRSAGFHLLFRVIWDYYSPKLLKFTLSNHLMKQITLPLQLSFSDYKTLLKSSDWRIRVLHFLQENWA